MTANWLERVASVAKRWPGGCEVALYGALATFWILGSDWLLELAIEDRSQLVVFGTLKGLVFVAVTALLLYRAHSALQHEIRTRRRVEDRLQQTISDLEAFSYSVSHDLRAPLSAINTFATCLQESEGPGMTERGRHRLGRIVAGANRMDRMICDILSCSRADRAEMRRQSVELEPLVAEVVAELRDAWPAARIVIGPMPAVQADAAMLRQVLCNLVGNALKFSGKRPDAQVEITAVQVACGVAEIRVRDNGAGFDMAYSAKLFGLFERLHTESEFPGTGVGLAIVKRLVSRHGGSIRAESKPGGWTTFAFTLATASVVATAAPRAPPVFSLQSH